MTKLFRGKIVTKYFILVLDFLLLVLNCILKEMEETIPIH